MTTLNMRWPTVMKPLAMPSRYKGAWGGRGGGKSHCFAEMVLLRCLERTTRAVCIREVQDSIKDSVKQLITDKINKLGLGAYFDITLSEVRSKKNDSLIIFKGMQEYNADNIKSLEGYDIAWVEEAQTLSQRSLTMLRPTIRNPGSEIWFSWNPRSKYDPVDEFFRGAKKHPDAVCIRVGWQDNPFFPEELKKEKDFDYDKDPLQAEHVWGGGYEIIAQGAYYAKLMHQAEMDGRIRDVPWIPGVDVYTFWDLGIGDPTAIWFAQQKDGWVHLIDYVEHTGEGAEFYAKLVKEKPYVYGGHVLPHDAGSADWSTGRTRVQTLAGLGINARVLEREAVVDDGIAAVRSLIPRCIFDAKKCERGIEALRHYRAEYDEKVLTLKNRPLHDWTSHGSDAFRYLARGLPDQTFIQKPADRYARRRTTGGSAWANL